METRRFSRVEYGESCVVEYGSVAVTSQLRNISLRGALVELGNGLGCRLGDRCRLLFHLGNPDYLMQFGGEIVHVRGRLSGIRFIDADLNTMFHLRNLLESITGNPDQLMREIDLLFEDEQLFFGSLRSN
jgi:hypothetical protein